MAEIQYTQDDMIKVMNKYRSAIRNRNLAQDHYNSAEINYSHRDPDLNGEHENVMLGIDLDKAKQELQQADENLAIAEQEYTQTATSLGEPVLSKKELLTSYNKFDFIHAKQQYQAAIDAYDKAFEASDKAIDDLRSDYSEENKIKSAEAKKELDRITAVTEMRQEKYKEIAKALGMEAQNIVTGEHKSE